MSHELSECCMSPVSGSYCDECGDYCNALVVSDLNDDELELVAAKWIDEHSECTGCLPELTDGPHGELNGELCPICCGSTISGPDYLTDRDAAFRLLEHLPAEYEINRQGVVKYWIMGDGTNFLVSATEADHDIRRGLTLAAAKLHAKGESCA